MRTNPDKKITRHNCAQLIGRAWLRAATPSNALGGFRGSGIYPLDPHAIPDSEFTIAESNPENNTTQNDEEVDEPACNMANRPSQEMLTDDRDSPSLINPNAAVLREEDETDAEEAIGEMEMRKLSITPEKKDREASSKTLPKEKSPTIASGSKDETPSKFLMDRSPIPNIPRSFLKIGKQGAAVLNTKSRIEMKQAAKDKQTKNIPNKTSKKYEGNKENRKDDTEKKTSSSQAKTAGNKRKQKTLSVGKKILAKRTRKPTRIYSSSSDEEEVDDTVCCVCLENYMSTKSKSDWIQCTKCMNWLHEVCTLFRNYCQKCGNLEAILSSRSKGAESETRVRDGDLIYFVTDF